MSVAPELIAQARAEFGWTPARVAVLKALVLDGRSAGEAAKILRITRNTAVGKGYRLGLRWGPAPGVDRVAPPEGRIRRATNPFGKEGVAGMKSRVGRERAASGPVKITQGGVRVGAADVPFKDLPAEAPGTATILTLGARMCKWPIGDPAADDFTFCGRVRPDGGTYCSEHARLAYQPRSERQKASDGRLERLVRRWS